MELDRERAAALLTAFHDRLTAARRDGHSRFEEAFQNPPAGVGVHEIDVSYVVRKVNDEELRILGYRREDMLGRSILDFIVMKEAANRAIQQKLSGAKELKPFVRTFQRADGSPVTLLLLDRHITDAQGQVAGIRTAMTRISS
jgi:PAS domain S-box-containing protein